MRFLLLALPLLGVANPALCLPQDVTANSHRDGNNSNSGRPVNVRGDGNGPGTGTNTTAGDTNTGNGNVAGDTVQTLTVNTVVDGSEITQGFFGHPNPVQGNRLEVKTVMPHNFVGQLEVEYNGTDSNTITVFPKQASITPPPGMMYLDPLSWTITSGTAIKVGDDFMQVDYIFTKEAIAAVDVSQAVMMRLDATDNAFNTDGINSTFKAEIQELVSVVDDMNGEWAIFVPVDAATATA
ncbi:hypothetical protein GGR57DRAFT_215794 [Xylariaceae sp. FL1272]|nr:hypothetical protein GGR57DRAFT_215794 [Xylariaceae sp. FL1272]